MPVPGPQKPTGQQYHPPSQQDKNKVFANKFPVVTALPLWSEWIVFKSNFHRRPERLSAAGVVENWMTSLLLTDCS